jgi:hypothetical protein
MGSKQKVIATTVQLLRRQGLSATGINRIIRESHSRRGACSRRWMAAPARRRRCDAWCATTSKTCETRQLAVAHPAGARAQGG